MTCAVTLRHTEVALVHRMLARCWDVAFETVVFLDEDHHECGQMFGGDPSILCPRTTGKRLSVWILALQRPQMPHAHGATPHEWGTTRSRRTLAGCQQARPHLRLWECELNASIERRAARLGASRSGRSGRSGTRTGPPRRANVATRPVRNETGPIRGLVFSGEVTGSQLTDQGGRYAVRGHTGGTGGKPRICNRSGPQLGRVSGNSNVFTGDFRRDKAVRVGSVRNS